MRGLELPIAAPELTDAALEILSAESPRRQRVLLQLATGRAIAERSARVDEEPPWRVRTMAAMPIKTVALYVVTALAEIGGCYLALLFFTKKGGWWLVPAAIMTLALFAWLLTLHDAASGRVYAAYGGVYIATALAWLWFIDGVRPTAWDAAGVAVSLLGMALIAFQPK